MMQELAREGQRTFNLAGLEVMMGRRKLTVAHSDDAIGGSPVAAGLAKATGIEDANTAPIVIGGQVRVSVNDQLNAGDEVVDDLRRLVQADLVPVEDSDINAFKVKLLIAGPALAHRPAVAIADHSSNGRLLL